MGQAKALDVRYQVVHLREAGRTFECIAVTLKVSVRTCKTYWKRYKEGGKDHLVVRYGVCSRPVDISRQAGYRLVRLLKHLHSTWGIPYIVLRIKDKYPELPLQSVRHYQRRVHLDTEAMPRSILHPQTWVWQSRMAHDTWQIDAKERLTLKDGQVACYLTITDEATGAILAAEPFSPQPDQSGSYREDSCLFDSTISSLDYTQGDSYR
jgi:hypothetical protein